MAKRDKIQAFFVAGNMNDLTQHSLTLTEQPVLQYFSIFTVSFVCMCVFV